MAGPTVVKDAKSGVSYVADGFVTGLDEFKQLIADSAERFWDGLGEFAGGSQVTAPCDEGDPAYAISAPSDKGKFPGCVHPSGGDQVLEIENHWLLPFGLMAPAGGAPAGAVLALRQAHRSDRGFRARGRISAVTAASPFPGSLVASSAGRQGSKDREGRASRIACVPGHGRRPATG